MSVPSKFKIVSNNFEKIIEHYLKLGFNPEYSNDQKQILFRLRDDGDISTIFDKMKGKGRITIFISTETAILALSNKVRILETVAGEYLLDENFKLYRLGYKGILYGEKNKVLTFRNKLNEFYSFREGKVLSLYNMFSIERNNCIIFDDNIDFNYLRMEGQESDTLKEIIYKQNELKNIEIKDMIIVKWNDQGRSRSPSPKREKKIRSHSPSPIKKKHSKSRSPSPVTETKHKEPNITPPIIPSTTPPPITPKQSRSRSPSPIKKKHSKPRSPSPVTETKHKEPNITPPIIPSTTIPPILPRTTTPPIIPSTTIPPITPKQSRSRSPSPIKKKHSKSRSPSPITETTRGMQ